VSVGAIERRPVLAVTGMIVEARIAAGPGVATVTSGGDVRRLQRALEAAAARGVIGIISFGIAGGLVASTIPGSWIVATDVVTGNARWVVDATWASALASCLPGALLGTLAGSDTIVGSPEAKRALGAQTRAIAVDMESHIAAACAASCGVAFAAFRVIADPATRALAPAAAQGLRPDGTVNQRAVFSSLARRPGQLPVLMRNAIDAQTALRALSRGRRLLGLGLGYPNLGQLLIDMT
jgi:adenosylhomocysteine nucleosidase